MKKIILLLSVIVVVGAGCESMPSQPKPSVGILPIAKTDKINGITISKWKWVPVNSANGANFSQNVSFMRPPEFTVSGSDADYGRITILEFNNKPAIEIIENSIFLTCPKSECEDLEDYVGTTPQKYFNSYLQKLEKEGVKVEDKKVGNLLGKVFINKQNQAIAIVLFNNVMYTIIDESGADGGGVFYDLVASFQFNGELGNDRGFDGP